MRTSTAPVSIDAVELAALRAAVVELTARVEQLEALRPRDRADGALRQQLATSTRGLAFKSHELLRHGAVDADLRRALVGADCVDPASIGVWLRRARGVQAGVSVERIGRQWRVTHAAHTCIDPIG